MTSDAAGDDDPQAVQARPADEPHPRDRSDDGDPDDDVDRAVRQRLPAERVPEVVRDEQARDRDHDQEVEEEHPAGEKAERVVERAAHEGRGSTGLGNRRRPLAYERATSRKSTPTNRSTHGVKPSAKSAMMPRAKKSEEAISP